MAPVGRVKKPACPGDLNLGAGVPLVKAFWRKSGNGLEDRQRSRHGVKALSLGVSQAPYPRFSREWQT